MYSWINISYKSIILVPALSSLRYMELVHCISCRAIFKDAMLLLSDLFRTLLVFYVINSLCWFIRAYLLFCFYAIYRLTKIMSFLFQLLHRKGIQAEKIYVCLPFLPYIHGIFYFSFSLRSIYHVRLLFVLLIQTCCSDYFDWPQIYLRVSLRPAFTLFYQRPRHVAFENGTTFTWVCQLFAGLEPACRGHSLQELYPIIMP